MAEFLNNVQRIVKPRARAFALPDWTDFRMCGRCCAVLRRAYGCRPRFCSECVEWKRRATAWLGRQAKPLIGKAHSKVASAILRGQLPEPSTLECVDCGVQAQCYDHRDYTKPLAVQPVCHSCNSLRGPGYPYNKNVSSTRVPGDLHAEHPPTAEP